MRDLDTQHEGPSSALSLSDCSCEREVCHTGAAYSNTERIMLV